MLGLILFLKYIAAFLHTLKQICLYWVCIIYFELVGAAYGVIFYTDESPVKIFNSINISFKGTSQDKKKAAKNEIQKISVGDVITKTGKDYIYSK